MPSVPTTDIAITGMSCRFPGAGVVAAFRDILVNGRNAFRHLSIDEVVAAGVPSSVAADPRYVRVAAPLEGIDEFDTDTFGLVPGEAAVMDPQHYHFLECTYETLHAARCLPDSKARRIGVFAGADLSYYAVKRIPDDTLWDPMGRWQDLMGNDSHFLATSISYRLGLTGPSVGVQTACSTSLVAVHMAVQALLAGDCDVAVAGGASIRGPQTRGYLHRDGSILSPTGTCHPFDRDANGTVLSSGVGAVVLMRLTDALAEHYPIWAVVKGTAVNNDGNRKVGYTAPSVEGQAMAMAEALSVAKVNPATIGYVEAHGTGTRLGDAIEHRALINAYGSTSRTGWPILIGSVKSNFGHLESAAGIAGLIKAVLSVRYGEVYPSLGFASPNPEIDFKNGPFRVADRLEAFPVSASPRRAGVSSFGIGGTNCHVVIEEAFPPPGSPGAPELPEPQAYAFHRSRVWIPPGALTSVSPHISTSHPNPPNSKPDATAVLAGLWRDILGKAPEPADGFLEVGGDSLKATQFAIKVRDILGVELAVTDILEVERFNDLTDAVAEATPGVIEADCPLSAGQQSLWSWQSLVPSSPAYTVQSVFCLKGTIDTDALRMAVDDLVRRQDALRSVFSEVNGQVRQRIVSDCVPMPWRCTEVTDDEKTALDLVAKHGRTVIDLASPPLLSVLLIRTAKDGHLLSVISHHIVSDEWSAQVMLGDVLEFYAARVAGRPPALRGLETSMGELAQREQQWLNSKAAISRLDYWRSKLTDVPRFDLPWDCPRREPRAYVGSVIPLQISADTYDKVRALAHAHRSTSFMVLVAVFKIMWLRYTGQTDICIGTNIAGREDGAASDVVGLFTNTVALRTDLSHNPTFAEALRRVRTTALEAYEHQLPFSVVVDGVKPPREPSRNAFFDIMLVLQNVPQRMRAELGLAAEAVPFHNGTCKFDLELTLEECSDGALAGQWEYDTELFDKHTVEQFSLHYIQLLGAAVENPEQHLSRLRLVSPKERTTLLDQWNRTEVDFGLGDRSLWDIFAEQAGLHGASPAVISPGGNVTTYDEVARRSRALAARLRSEDIKPGDLVGILCERSESYIQALLAINACGAAFLPLDPSLPDSRLADLLRDARIRHVVTRKPHLSRLLAALEPQAGYSLRKVLLEDLGDAPVQPNTIVPVSDLAYVIYTSGSTGKPKGAMVSQAGMLNHLYAKIETLDVTDATRLAFTAPLCFDISIWQCLAPLLVGGSVIVIDDEDMMDVGALFGRLADDQVDIVELVPTYLDVLIGHVEHCGRPLPKLKFMVATGERLPLETCRRWFDHFSGIPIVNAYGPTECSDDVLQYVVQEKPSPEAVSIPIGYALPNAKVFVLDNQHEPVPVGVVGEIYVGGVCVGLGYLNDPEKTAAAFLPDPFSGEPRALLYRTGDLGRRRRDGAIDYLGRRDGQVKVHGARVEIEEVEAVLRQCAGIGEIAVVPNEHEDSLVALVTHPAESTQVDMHHLREHAQARLPRFMHPSAFFLVDAIPKTTSGKVDRAALRSMAREAGSQEPTCSETVAPEATGALAKLHNVWCRVLNRTSLPADAHFFEIGGDSLKAIRVVSLAQRSGASITPADVFAHPVLEDLAGICDGRPASVRSVVPLAAADASRKLTRGEQWFVDQELPDAHLCDSAFLLTLAPGIQARAVEQAVISLWDKHEGLRARFTNDAGGDWRKTILPASVPAPFSAIETSDDMEEFASQFIVAERDRTPGKDGPLFRTTLFTHGNESWLLVVAHYLACDSVSWHFLLDDFEEALKSQWCGSTFQESVIPRQAHAPVFESSERVSELSSAETKQLIGIAGHTGFTIEAMLTAALALAMGRHRKERLVPIAIGRHGRSTCDLEHGIPRGVGRFAYPMMINEEIGTADGLEQVLQRVRERLAKISDPVTATARRRYDGQFVAGLDYLGDPYFSATHGHAIRSVVSVPRRHLPATAQPYSLECLGQIIDGRLTLRCRSADAECQPADISRDVMALIRDAVACNEGRDG